MKIPNLRGCHDTTGGLVYFGRMLDKIRLHAQGQLPADYHENLGKGFDARCCGLLRVKYDDIIARVKQGGSDEEILAWCFTKGRKPSNDDVEIWNDYMRKRGWRDDASKRLSERLQESGLSHRTDIQTFFDYIDADEGREVRTKFESP